eukprot:5826655-Amphidinium_carterae.1
MEAHAQSVENHLIEGLNFSLGAGANYVTSRRSVTYQTTGGNLFSPSGIKVIRFQITGQEEFLDPTTTRMRILCNGVLVEDIDHYARTYKTFEMLSDPAYVQNLEAEGISHDAGGTTQLAGGTSRI